LIQFSFGGIYLSAYWLTTFTAICIVVTVKVIAIIHIYLDFPKIFLVKVLFEFTTDKSWISHRN